MKKKLKKEDVAKLAKLKRRLSSARKIRVEGKYAILPSGLKVPADAFVVDTEKLEQEISELES